MINITNLENIRTDFTITCGDSSRDWVLMHFHNLYNWLITAAIIVMALYTRTLDALDTLGTLGTHGTLDTLDTLDTRDTLDTLDTLDFELFHD